MILSETSQGGKWQMKGQMVAVQVIVMVAFNVSLVCLD